MAFDQFAQPAEQGSVDTNFALKDYMGALLLVYPRSFQSQVETKFGVSDAMAADLVVLDGPESPQVHVNVWLWGAALVPQLQPSVGKGPVLGRVGQSVAKPGKSPAWLLESYTPQDATVASAYLKANPDPFSEPVNFTAPATTNGLSAPGATPLAAASTPINTDDPAVVALLAQLAKQQAGAGAPPF
jgi:hypothetical protein